MDGHGTSPGGRCEGNPDPSEVSSLRKLRVFSKQYNLLTRNVLHHDYGDVYVAIKLFAFYDVV
jgi:hypothetical protein